MASNHQNLSRPSSCRDISPNPGDASRSPPLHRISEIKRPKPSGSDHGELHLPQLQVANGEPEGLEPIGVDDADPANFDLVAPTDQKGTTIGKHKLEVRSELMFSARHLQAIFDDSTTLHLFSRFLRQHRPESVPLLTYYLQALKAVRAIEYSNAILRNLEPLADYDFTHRLLQSRPTVNTELHVKAQTAFELLARDDLPMYITHTWIQIVSSCIKHRIIGTPPRHEYEGLAEVFCLTDPWRQDNPIVFMSEEFNRTTQYGVDYVIGRNCRFLQGPCTNPFSIHRIRKKLEAGEEHYETFLNYRRDGSPFMNLVMLAPLYDSRGRVRYFLGAQVDVSGLAMSSYGLDAMKRLVGEVHGETSDKMLEIQSRDEFTELAQILSPQELEVVRRCGGDMHRHIPLQSEQRGAQLERTVVTGAEKMHNQDSDHTKNGSSKHRILIQDPESPVHETVSTADGPEGTSAASLVKQNGRLSGVYENYLLVRPYPSMRILFTSPSMRVPGILQSPLLDRIGGSTSMREKLENALSEGRGVTAKVRWMSTLRNTSTHPNHINSRFEKYRHHADGVNEVGDEYDAPPVSKGRSRWLHCTPLIGSNGNIGVWMVVIIDAEGNSYKGKKTSINRQPTAGPNHLTTNSTDTASVAGDSGSPQETKSRFQETGDARVAASASFSKSNDGVAPSNVDPQLALNHSRSPTPSLKNGAFLNGFFNSDALSRAEKYQEHMNGTQASAQLPHQSWRSNKRSAVAPWWSPPGDASEWKAQQDLRKETSTDIREGSLEVANHASKSNAITGVDRPRSPGSLFHAHLDTQT